MKWTVVDIIFLVANLGLGVLNLFCYLYREHHWYNLAVAIANFAVVGLLGWLYTRELK